MLIAVDLLKIKMKNFTARSGICRSLFVFLFMAIHCGNNNAQVFEWKTGSPEESGFSLEKIIALRDTLASHRTTSLLIIRDDNIILEWYAPGWDKNRTHYSASLAKAVVGGFSLLLAMNDERIDPDEPVCRYIPEWKNDPIKSKITVLSLATHSSGIEDAELNEKDVAAAKEDGIKIVDKHMDIPGWKGNFWRQDPDPFTMARDYAPTLFLPGSSYHYSNPGMAMLSYSVTASYKGTDYKDIRSLLEERIYTPIGMKKDDWQIGYGKTFEVDGLRLVPNWGGGSFTPRAVARLGRLMLNNGNWEGKQLIGRSQVERAISYAGTPLPPRSEKDPSPASGLCWYNNYDGVWPRAPRDLFLGSGAGNQTLIVIPSLKIIIVRMGENMYYPGKGEGHFYGYEKYLINMLMDAFIEAPYPQSEVIREVKFAPVSTIIRKAEGSDNWPSTWGDDDALYTAYGDGWGFEPRVEKKLSLGLAKVTGDPEELKGYNLRSASGEYTGDGASGKKASGILMVDGILYLFVRNADGKGEESQLKWSDNKGLTWKECNWKFTEGFGCPTFLNFGRNYNGSRDNFIYIYSFDGRSAYKPSDRMVLARVLNNRITERSEYEFYSHTNDDGDAVWEKAIEKRGEVFTHPAMCYRSGITYNAGLKRYLWCQVHPHSNHPQGPRFQGGFGIYEAPEPWGPWRTVYYTREWDTGPGETSSFPAKWMSKNGKTCYLLFSGNDSFSVRKVEFITR